MQGVRNDAIGHVHTISVRHGAHNYKASLVRFLVRALFVPVKGAAASPTTTPNSVDTAAPAGHQHWLCTSTASYGAT